MNKKISRVIAYILAALTIFAYPISAAALTNSASPYTGKTYTHNSKFDKYDRYDGIDVSSHNGTINWNSVKADGIDYAVLRAGFTGYTKSKHSLNNDTLFSEYYKGAVAAELPVGVYWYSQALNENEARAEAQRVLSVIDGLALELPVFYDYEFAGTKDGRLDSAWSSGSINKSKMTANARAFCEVIEAAGYEAAIYSNSSFLTNQLDINSLDNNYKIWLAHFTTQTDYSGNYYMWQYTESGSVDGIGGSVDCDFMYLPKGTDIGGNAKVTGLRLTARGGDGERAKIEWNAVPGATKYEIIEITNGINRLKGTATTTNFTFTDLVPGWTYEVKVVAYCENGKLAESEGYTFGAACPTVQNLKASVTGTNTIEAKWDVTTSHGYRLEWSTTSDFSKDVNGTYISGTNSTSYTIKTEKPADQYYVRVRAYKLFNDSTIYGAFSEPVSLAGQLLPVTGVALTARGGDGERARIDWNAVNGAVRYEVYEITNGINRLKGETTDTNFTFTDLVPGWTYEVKVVAYNAAGESSESEGYTFGAACPTVQNLKASVTDTNTIEAKWDVTTSHGYRLEWSTSADFSKDVNGTYISGTNSTSYTIKTEKPADQYYVRVRAYKLFQDTTIYGAFTQPIDIMGIEITARGGDGERARIDWNDAEDAVRYEVYEITNGINRLKGNTIDPYFTFTDLVPGWTYEVKVVAYNADDEKLFESEGYTFGAACPTVQNLKASVTGTNTIEAQWDVTTSHGYRLEWSTTSDFSKDVNGTYISGTNSTSYTIKTEKPADQYYVRVRAYKLFNDSTIYGAFTQPVEL